MVDEELKKLLGDMICNYCPAFERDGKYCDAALSEYMNTNSDDVFENTIGIIETTDDELSKILENSMWIQRMIPKSYPKFVLVKEIEDARKYCKYILGKLYNSLYIIEYGIYRVDSMIYVKAKIK